MTARKVGVSGKKVQVEHPDGHSETLAATDCVPMKKTSLKRLVEDLTLLDDMSAQLILHNLKSRFQSREIYTSIGTILVSVNPYELLPIYTDEVLKRYATRKPGKELPPHVYNVAHDAFYGVTAFKKLQSIVISGESGAGKTEATKRCLQYIAAVASSGAPGGGVEGKILEANPILEAFGNAKTLRNDNSSRFGKYMEVRHAELCVALAAPHHTSAYPADASADALTWNVFSDCSGTGQVFFDARAKINGCATQNYLLEKVSAAARPGV